MREKVRFGIVGCGVIHETHIHALAGVEGAELVAVYDINQERAQKAAEKFGVKRARTLSELIEAVDAVTVCVPSGLHAKIGIQAARAGKHVLVEKPIDVTLKAATALVTAARTAGTTLSVISQHRFAPDIHALRDTVKSGQLGQMLAGDAYVKWYRTQAYYDSGDWRGTKKLDGGGCLMNQGVHYVDMLQWVMGGVASVQAQTRTVAHKIEVEDIANALLTFRSGAVGVLQGSTSSFPGFAERLEVHGRLGSAIIEGDRLKVFEQDLASEEDASPYGRGVTAQPTPNVHGVGTETNLTAAADPKVLWIEQHRLQIEDFTLAILERREPFMTGEMALEPLKVILAIYRSAQRNGATVHIDSPSAKIPQRELTAVSG
jgi:UDP-N-acetyl-2-amino-2-deoxyglucuronate dehydrogenase